MRTGMQLWANLFEQAPTSSRVSRDGSALMAAAHADTEAHGCRVVLRHDGRGVHHQDSDPSFRERICSFSSGRAEAVRIVKMNMELAREVRAELVLEVGEDGVLHPSQRCEVMTAGRCSADAVGSWDGEDRVDCWLASLKRRGRRLLMRWSRPSSVYESLKEQTRVFHSGSACAGQGREWICTE